MWEFEIVNKASNEHKILCGRDFDKLITSAGLSEDEWELVMQEYVD